MAESIKKLRHTQVDLVEDNTLKWVRVIYFSELSFLFHLPLFINLRSSHPKPAKPRFQEVIFILRNILNIVFLGIYFRADLTHYTWYILLVSFILYYISFEHQKLHLAKKIIHEATKPQEFTTIVPGILYGITHTFSLLNFSFDLPSIGIPVTRVTRTLVCAINIFCIVAYLFVFFFEAPLEDAWGCYASYDGLSDYNFGMCPLAFGKLAASCCDQPGVDCSKDGKDTAATYNNLKAHMHIALGLSFGIYSISALTKLSYLKTIEKEARNTIITETEQDTQFAVKKKV